MPTTLGAYTWTRSRGVTGAGEVGLASDPVAGYANTLWVSATDRYGNSRLVELTAVVEGDTIALIDDKHKYINGIVTADPVGVGTAIGFPFLIRPDPRDEPTNNADVTLYASATASTGWPTTDELAQVLDVDNVAAWQTTLDRLMASAIDAVKGDVGSWTEGADGPDANLAAAALRMAELMAQRPDASVVSLKRDASYLAHLTGKTRRFGLA